MAICLGFQTFESSSVEGVTKLSDSLEVSVRYQPPSFSCTWFERVTTDESES